MDAVQQSAIIAAGDIDQLASIHARFVGQLQAAPERNPAIGTLVVSSDVITCQCLGHKVTAAHRPVAVDGQVRALEYDFTVIWVKEPLSILRLFLQPHGVITRDLKGESKFQDFNNSYVKDHILAAVSAALLRSQVFSAREA